MLPEHMPSNTTPRDCHGVKSSRLVTIHKLLHWCTAEFDAGHTIGLQGLVHTGPGMFVAVVAEHSRVAGVNLSEQHC